MSNQQRQTNGIKSVGWGLFAAFIVVWTIALFLVEPAYSGVALAAAAATFVLSARYRAKSTGRSDAAAIAARADQGHAAALAEYERDSGNS